MVRHRFQVKWIGNAYFYVKETGDAPLSAGFDQSLLGAIKEKDSCLYRQALGAYRQGDGQRFAVLLEEWQKEAMLHDSTPEDVAFAVLAAEFFLDRGDVYSTLQFCQQAIARNPSSPEAHLVASLAYLENGLTDQARLELDTARYLDPDSWLVSWIGYRLGGEQAAAELARATRLYREKKAEGWPGFPASMKRREWIEQQLASGEMDEMV
jgi:predicted Zn-dependent protease